MKKIILFLVFAITNFAFTIQAQCTAIASGFGNNSSVPSYNITGMNSVQVVLNTNNTVTLNLMSNFVTANGPDVRAYLVAPGSLTNAMLKTMPIGNLTRIEMGMVSNSTTMASGAKSFTKAIPMGQNISNYTKVFFYCAAAGAFWDLGTIVPFTGANCAFLGTEKFEEINGLSIYPNPVKDILNIELADNDNFQVKIYNIFGSVLLEKSNFSGTQIDLSSLTNGVYIAEIVNASNQITRKRFVKNN